MTNALQWPLSYPSIAFCFYCLFPIFPYSFLPSFSLVFFLSSILLSFLPSFVTFFLLFSPPSFLHFFHPSSLPYNFLPSFFLSSFSLDSFPLPSLIISVLFFRFSRNFLLLILIPFLFITGTMNSLPEINPLNHIVDVSSSCYTTCPRACDLENEVCLPCKRGFRYNPQKSSWSHVDCEGKMQSFFMFL